LPLVTGAPSSIISDFSTLTKSARGDDDAIAVKSSIIISQAKFCSKQFKWGRDLMEDDPHSGRHSDVITD